MEKQRAPILAELSAELGAMKAASSKGATAFLEHVYEKYGTKETPARGAGATISKQCQKALMSFHPDKCQADVKTKTIREEITKHLNHHYAATKGD
jgi:hypothetical protein